VFLALGEDGLQIAAPGPSPRSGRDEGKRKP